MTNRPLSTKVRCSHALQHTQHTTLLTFIGVSPIVECMKLFLNAAEVAKLLSVDRATVSRWVKKGLIKGVVRPTGARNWRIPLTSYEEIIKTQR
jgi:excisionase family DNA binding protein